MYFLTSCITIACAFHAPSFHHNRKTVNTPLIQTRLAPIRLHGAPSTNPALQTRAFWQSHVRLTTLSTEPFAPALLIHASSLIRVSYMLADMSSQHGNIR